ncbi:MAG: alkylation response protein AidB-like acyl-CoA dehydrogenase [Hyphomicrobiaceae bacterium]|jgi:alkylation response protein AidB-like acyl-CoA dehydrogenase
MGLVLNEDQEMLRDSAADFVKKESPVSRVRQLRDANDPLGYSKETWGKMAALGWPAILVPEEFGGLGMGMVEMACVLEECGRNLVPEPLLSTCVLGGQAIVLGGSVAQKKAVLPSVADGSLLLALAYQEKRSRFSVTHCETAARAEGTGFVLDGEKTLVWDGHTADKIIVSARSRGGVADQDGITLFLVDATAAGVEITRQSTMHLRNAALVSLTGVEVGADAVLGTVGGGAAVLEDVIDRATAALSAEMLGVMQTSFALTLDYLKTRKQFGVLIGTFQALKHRAANIFVELELSRSAVYGAATAIDENAKDWRSTVSVAKARCSDSAVLAGYEGIQMHGGIGMTDEADIGFYAKRARGSELTFGDAAYHRDRFATLQGF